MFISWRRRRSTSINSISFFILFEQKRNQKKSNRQKETYNVSANLEQHHKHVYFDQTNKTLFSVEEIQPKSSTDFKPWIFFWWLYHCKSKNRKCEAFLIGDLLNVTKQSSQPWILRLEKERRQLLCYRNTSLNCTQAEPWTLLQICLMMLRYFLDKGYHILPFYTQIC